MANRGGNKETVGPGDNPIVSEPAGKKGSKQKPKRDRDDDDFKRRQDKIRPKAQREAAPTRPRGPLGGNTRGGGMLANVMAMRQGRGGGGGGAATSGYFTPEIMEGLLNPNANQQPPQRSPLAQLAYDFANGYITEEQFRAGMGDTGLPTVPQGGGSYSASPATGTSYATGTTSGQRAGYANESAGGQPAPRPAPTTQGLPLQGQTGRARPPAPSTYPGPTGGGSTPMSSGALTQYRPGPGPSGLGSTPMSGMALRNTSAPSGAVYGGLGPRSLPPRPPVARLPIQTQPVPSDLPRQNPGFFPGTPFGRRGY